jgi:hypothetical protein
MIAFLTLTFIPMQSKAETEASSMAANKSAAEAHVLLARIYEINAMDKSKLSSTDKKQLRSEVSSIKSQLRQPGRGVYVSFTALIVIIILLVILL